MTTPLLRGCASEPLRVLIVLREDGHLRGVNDLILLDRSMLTAAELRSVRKVLERGCPLIVQVALEDARHAPPAEERAATTSPISAPPSEKFLQRIPVRTREGFRILPVEELVSAVAHGENLHLTTSSGEQHVILYPLKDLAARLEPGRFISLSRSTLVNVSCVTQVVPGRNGLLTVALRNGEQHWASRLQSRQLRKRLLRL